MVHFPTVRISIYANTTSEPLKSRKGKDSVGFEVCAWLRQSEVLPKLRSSSQGCVGETERPAVKSGNYKGSGAFGVRWNLK